MKNRFFNNGYFWSRGPIVQLYQILTLFVNCFHAGINLLYLRSKIKLKHVSYLLFMAGTYLQQVIRQKCLPETMPNCFGISDQSG